MEIKDSGQIRSEVILRKCQLLFELNRSDTCSCVIPIQFKKFCAGEFHSGVYLVRTTENPCERQKPPVSKWQNTEIYTAVSREEQLISQLAPPKQNEETPEGFFQEIPSSRNPLFSSVSCFL